jgi:single-stranded-DNA-specific exonuclease
LRALFDAAGADGPPTPFHLGFLIGPRINAGGRIGDSSLGARLLMTEDDIEAAQIAQELDRLNRERRVIEAAAVEEAEAEVLATLGPLLDKGSCLVCAAEHWHPGILGLVAARLKERFQRPAFVLALTGETAVGSGRSVPGIDLGRAVLAAVEAGLATKGGGHAMAAGITISSERVDEFRAFLDARLGSALGQTLGSAALVVDATLSAAALTPDLVAALDGAGPFGAAHPEVVVALPRLTIRGVQPVGADHIRIDAQAMDGTRIKAVAFRASNSPLAKGLQGAIGRSVHLAGTLSVNRWGGSSRAELRLLDAALA